MSALDHQSMERVPSRPLLGRSIFGAVVFALAVSATPPFAEFWVDLWIDEQNRTEWTSADSLRSWFFSGILALWGWVALASGLNGRPPRPCAFEARSDWAPGAGIRWRRVILHHPAAVHELRESRPDERLARWYPIRGVQGRRTTLLSMIVQGITVRCRCRPAHST